MEFVAKKVLSPQCVTGTLILISVNAVLIVVVVVVIIIIMHAFCWK
jgi:hypothetical protein